MKLAVADEVLADIAAASRWYDDKQPGLGTDFIAAVDAAFVTILERPEAWAADPCYAPKVVRRYVMHRFPFVIFYRVGERTLEIAGLAHTSRRPGAWQR